MDNKREEGKRHMLLAINAQNTFITIGCFRKDQLEVVTRLATEPRHSADQYACAISDVLRLRAVDRRQIGGAILCSVVPALSSVLMKKGYTTAKTA